MFAIEHIDNTAQDVAPFLYTSCSHTSNLYQNTMESIYFHWYQLSLLEENWIFVGTSSRFLSYLSLSMEDIGITILQLQQHKHII